MVASHSVKNAMRRSLPPINSVEGKGGSRQCKGKITSVRPAVRSATRENRPWHSRWIRCMWYTKKSETTTLSERYAQGFSRDAEIVALHCTYPNHCFSTCANGARSWVPERWGRVTDNINKTLQGCVDHSLSPGRGTHGSSNRKLLCGI